MKTSLIARLLLAVLLVMPQLSYAANRTSGKIENLALPGYTDPDAATGGSTPGGSSGDIQYNNAGVLGGLKNSQVVDKLINTSTLPHFEAALQRYRGLGSNRVRIVVMSDSTGVGGVAPDVGWPYQLANAIQNRGYKANHGSSFGGIFAVDTQRITIGSSWTIDNTITSVGGSTYKASTTTNALSFLSSWPISHCRVWYVKQPGGGTFTHGITAVGGLTSTSTDDVAGFDYADWTSGGNTFANSACDVKYASGGQVNIAGFETWDGGGVSIINTSLGGSAVSGWSSTTNPYSWLNATVAMAPDLVIMAPGINSMPGVSLATYEAQIRTVITALQAANIDIIMMTPVPQNPADGTHNVSVLVQDGYVGVNRSLAAEYGIPLVDPYAAFVSYAFSNSAPYSRYVDNWTHPNSNGYGLISDLVYFRLFGLHPAAPSGDQTVPYHTINALNAYQIRGKTSLSRAGTGSVVVGVSGATGTASTNSVYVGDGAGALASNGQNQTAVGKGALAASQAGKINNTAIGFEALKASTGNDNTALGLQAGLLVTSGSDNLLLGYKVGSTVLTTGSRNLLIGTSNAITTPALGTNDWLSIDDIIVGSKVAPTASSCGTGPAVTGNGIVGTVVTGSGATACTLTFATAKAAAPSCVVSARSGTQPVYTTSTSALTLSTAAASATYDYFCSGK